jgi:hypothetical protein
MYYSESWKRQGGMLGYYKGAGNHRGLLGQKGESTKGRAQKAGFSLRSRTPLKTVKGEPWRRRLG